MSRAPTLKAEHCRTPVASALAMETQPLQKNLTVLAWYSELWFFVRLCLKVMRRTAMEEDTYCAALEKTGAPPQPHQQRLPSQKYVGT